MVAKKEKMKKNIFCVPIFEFDVDLNYINVPASEEHFAPTWESKVQSTFRSRNLSRVPKDTVRYLTDKIVSCLRELEDPVDYIQIENIWKNKYDVHDFQGYHTHSIPLGVSLSMRQFRNHRLDLLVLT